MHMLMHMYICISIYAALGPYYLRLGMLQMFKGELPLARTDLFFWISNPKKLIFRFFFNWTRTMSRP